MKQIFLSTLLIALLGCTDNKSKEKAIAKLLAEAKPNPEMVRAGEKLKAEVQRDRASDEELREMAKKENQYKNEMESHRR